MIKGRNPVTYMAEQKDDEKHHRHCTAWCEDHPCPTQDTWKDEAGKKDLEHKEYQKLGRWLLDSVLDFFIESKAIPKGEIHLNQEEDPYTHNLKNSIRLLSHFYYLFFHE